MRGHLGGQARKANFRKLCEHVRRDHIHRLLMIVRFKQMSIAIHRHLQTAMAGEGLYLFGLRVRLDPTRYREVP